MVDVVDAQRALELLQQYRAKLRHRHQNQGDVGEGLVEEDHQLNQSLDRVINVFQSQLFSALLGEEIFLIPHPVILCLNAVGVKPPVTGNTNSI